MIRRKEIEIALDRLTVNPQPKVWLEQYTIPSRTAAEMLFIASNVRGDIAGKSIVDLGCGTGRLAIGASILGAKEVTAVDIDPMSIQIAKGNAKSFQTQNNIDWINSDIDAIRGSFDTAVMNPPFGTRSEHADRKFLLKALSIADVTYSLHKRSTRPYLLKLIKENSGRVEALYEIELQIPRTYDFHNRKKHDVEVDFYVARSKLMNRKTYARS
jgi:putative methylase